jgi:prepilin-type N-terminal cleavage/methylation domain-containing protein
LTARNPFGDTDSVAAARRGFSLIEVLVVIGIIGVLIAFLLPALEKADAQAKTTQCQSNLRQLGFCLNIYANDWSCSPVSLAGFSDRGQVLRSWS